MENPKPQEVKDVKKKDDELSEDDLKKVDGGLDGVKGEATDQDHKDWIRH